jgi:hypothetical protein
MSDALGFARRVAAERVLLFHHDPLHSDDRLDSFFGSAIGHWSELGGDPAQIEMAVERGELEIGSGPVLSAAGA